MKIKVVAETGKSSIVEYYDGSTQRVVVPSSVIHGDTLDDADLAAGVPYGVPWQAVTTPEIANELRRVGIWTAQDLDARPQLAITAIQRVIGQTLAVLRKAAQKYEGGRK